VLADDLRFPLSVSIAVLLGPQSIEIGLAYGKGEESIRTGDDLSQDGHAPLFSADRGNTW
jgi:hypothetical protein